MHLTFLQSAYKLIGKAGSQGTTALAEIHLNKNIFHFSEAAKNTSNAELKVL